MSPEIASRSAMIAKQAVHRREYTAEDATKVGTDLILLKTAPTEEWK